MKHVEVRQIYSAARRIFNSLLSVSSGDETLRLTLDIFRTLYLTWSFIIITFLYIQQLPCSNLYKDIL